MKKFLVLTLLILVILCQPAAGQETHTVYLPLLLKGWSVTMSDWKVIIPEATINRALNPVAGTTGNFAALTGTTVTRSSTYSKWELYSYRVQCNADNEGASFTLDTLANAAHYVTMRVRGTLPSAWDWSLDDSNYTAPTLIETLDANWSLYGLAFVAGQANGSTTLYVRQNGAGSGDFYIDGIQVEEKDHWTTLCYGGLAGCEWRGAEHASGSQRSAQSRAGGRVRDLLDDYDFAVSDTLGVGAPQANINVDEYALLPGGALNSIKTPARRFTLAGVFKNSSWNGRSDLLAAREDLIEVLAPDAYAKDDGGYQPVRLRFTGGATQKEIAAHYEGGLEAAIGPSNILFEKAALRFLAEDPNWNEVGYSAAALDSNDTATLRYVAARLRSTGQWNDLGPPDAAGSYSNIYAIAEGPDGHIYIGGNFTNFDNIANADYIVIYDPNDDSYAALSSGLNGRVRALAFGPDGTLYIGGNFTDAGGDTDADYFCQWDGSAFGSVNATPLNGEVYDVEYAPNGKIYIGGVFENAGGDADADYVCVMEILTGAFSALNSTPLSSRATSLVASTTRLYIGGLFTNAGSDANADYICQYDLDAGGAFSSLTGTALNGVVYALGHNDQTNVLYIGGAFTNAGDDANADYICQYDGTAFSSLGSGADAQIDVHGIAVAPDGAVFVVGQYNEIGGLSVADRIAKWNGASWSHLDLNLPGSPTPVVAIGDVDPVVSTNYDVWLGFNTSGTGSFAGVATITNGGTAHAYPLIVIQRAGGTSATVESVRNETTGKELLLNYDLQDGETLYIDLAPTEKSITSSFFGSRPDAILANSDFGEWALQPGDNDVTCFVDEAGSPTVTAYMVWRDTYKSND